MRDQESRRKQPFWWQIPYANEQGIFSGKQGSAAQVQGLHLCQQGSSLYSPGIVGGVRNGLWGVFCWFHAGKTGIRLESFDIKTLSR